MKSSSRFTVLFALIFIGLTVSVAQGQLRNVPVDTTLDASEIVISDEMLRNASISKVRFHSNHAQSIFDKPITRAFLGLGKSIVGNQLDAPRSYSGFSPKNTADLYDGYRIFERTNEYPISKYSYGFLRNDF